MAKKKEAEARVVEAENRMYELMLVLKPDLLESAVTKKLKDFTKYLKDAGGSVTMEDIWGKRTLAYRIKQFDEGIYVVYNLEAPTTFISELDNHLRIDNEVIRHLLISIESDYKYSKFDEELEEAPKEKKKPAKKEEKPEKKVVKEEKKPAEEPKKEKEEVIEKKEEIVEEKTTESDVETQSAAADTSKEEEVVEEEKAEEKAEKTEEEIVEEPKKEKKGLLSKLLKKDKEEPTEGGEQAEVKEEKDEEKKDEKGKKDEIDRSALDSKLDDLLSGDDLNI